MTHRCVIEEENLRIRWKKTSSRPHHWKRTAIIDSCRTIYSQNPWSHVAKMYLSLLSHYSQPTSPFSTLATKSTIELQLHLQASMVDSVVAPILHRTPINTHNAKVVMGVMGWPPLKDLAMVRVKENNVVWLYSFCVSLNLQMRISV